MFILLIIALIVLLLVTTIWLNIECKQLKHKNRFLMDKLETLNTARLNYHNNNLHFVVLAYHYIHFL